MLKVQNLISLKYLTHNHWKYNVNKEHMFPCWIFPPKTWEHVLFVYIIAWKWKNLDPTAWKFYFLFQTFETLFLFLQYLTCICFPSISVIPNAFFSPLCMTSLICLSALQDLKDLAEKTYRYYLASHQVNEKNYTYKKYMQRVIVRNWQNKQCSRFSILRYKIYFFVPETFCLLSVTSLYRYNLLIGKLGLSVTSILTET